jgi:putative tryptophan/tyrosine transport system substrate-binding protein
MCLLILGADMRRREFLGVLSGAAAWPLSAHAQQPARPVIGYLSSRAAATETDLAAAFQRGLNELGYVDRQNVTFEYRWAEGQYDRLASLAAELVRRQVAVIVTTGGAAPAQAAKSATTSIPIVFTTGDDPVKLGLVSSLNRPDGNATGVAVFVASLLPKRLQILRELFPTASTVGFLMNPNWAASASQLVDVQHAAGALGVRLYVVRASTAVEIDEAFSVLGQQRPDALMLAADPFFQVRRDQLVTLAARYAIPTMYEWREFVDAGGLISYSPDRKDTMRQMGIYAGRILQGAKPSELPVVQAVKFELVINLRTSRALGLTIPPTLLARADEVIE